MLTQTTDKSAELFSLYMDGRLAQVYLFYGEYKNTAQDLAVKILSHSSGFNEQTVQKHVENRTFPNYFFVSDDKEITVEKVRELSVFLQDTPVLPGWRVVVIKPADALNISASNALLKNMEELPVKTTMILLVNSLYNIKQTVLSRAQKIFFPSQECAVETYISKNAWARDAIDVLEKTWKTKEMPDKTAMDKLAENAQMFPEVAKYFVWTRATRAPHDPRLVEKYDRLSEFIYNAADKSLAPAHFISALFVLLKA
ncbi:MAG: hypothetical protein LBQ43_01940 [Holosporales bacterium]|jgi:hypothetical protein|nr:hypothetical protein [Holosporales bacterium]